MFNAMVYQLNSNGVCDLDSDCLRQRVAHFMEGNTTKYCDFILPARLSRDNDNYDALTADTEPRTKKTQKLIDY